MPAVERTILGLRQDAIKDAQFKEEFIKAFTEAKQIDRGLKALEAIAKGVDNIEVIELSRTIKLRLLKQDHYLMSEEGKIGLKKISDFVRDRSATLNLYIERLYEVLPDLGNRKLDQARLVASFAELKGAFSGDWKRALKEIEVFDFGTLQEQEYVAILSILQGPLHRILQQARAEFAMASQARTALKNLKIKKLIPAEKAQLKKSAAKKYDAELLLAITTADELDALTKNTISEEEFIEETNERIEAIARKLADAAKRNPEQVLKELSIETAVHEEARK